MDLNREDTNYRKAAHYCGYQERTEKEVLKKLHIWGVEEEKTTYIIQTLKEERFLDEKRYVEAFIRRKCFAKRWGKIKIRAALTGKGLNQALIQEGLAAIEDIDYLQNLRHVAEQKKPSLAGVTALQASQKLTHYLLQKGYEPDLVIPIIQETTRR